MIKFNTAIDFWDKASSVRVFPNMKAQDFARLSPSMKQRIVGKKPN